MLAVIGFGVALWPRSYALMPSEGGPCRIALWPRLLRFPVFWLGLLLLLYILLQITNPSWRYVQNTDFWWLVRVKDRSWLPTSIQAPFSRFNPWRQLIIYASIWLLVCSVWVGLTRRKSLRMLLTAIVCNALALGVLLAIQRVTDNHRIPWPLTDWTDLGLTATFISYNHTGAFFALTVFCAFALASWHLDFGERSLLKSTPASAFAFAGLLLFGAVFFSLSRGASLSLIVGIAIGGAWFLVRRSLRPNSGGTNPLVAKAMMAVFLVFALIVIHYLDFSQIFRRWDVFLVQGAHESSVRERLLAREAGFKMLNDHWLRGVGAGCFRHLFPEYAKFYPDIYKGGQMFWEHAHCDWLEIPIELGLVGDLLLLGGVAWWFMLFFRSRAFLHPLAVPLLLGCGQTLIHAYIDFPFQCPAILATWCVMLAIAGRYVEIEQHGRI